MEEMRSSGGDVHNMVSSNTTSWIPTPDRTGEQPEIDISNADAARFLSKLISLGYLHSATGSSNNNNSSNDAEPLLPLQEPQELTLESTMLAKSKLAQRRTGSHRRFTADDPNCCIVLKKKTCGGQGGAATAGGAAATEIIDGCVTRTELVNQIKLSIDCPTFGGRASISSLATHLSVDEAAIESSVANFASVAPSLAEYVQVGNDVVSSHHFDLLANKVDAMISAAGEGHVAIAELAMNVYDMPFDVCLASLVERLPTFKCSSRIGSLHFGSGGGGSTRREVVSAVYDNDRSKELQTRLDEAREPTHLIDLVQELQWDDEFAHDRVMAMIADGSLKGELKVDGDTYVPRVYAEVQRQGVDEFYSANGYVNAELVISLGLPASNMGQYVRESFPNAVELSDAVIDIQALIDPLEGLIEEAITLRSYLDMRAALPEALVSSEGDMQKILEDVLPPRLAENSDFPDGVCIVCDGEALYYSRGMIQDVETKVVSPLIESYGKTRAQEIDDALNSSPKKRQSSSVADANDDGEIIRTGAKLKKSGKRGGGKKPKIPQEHVTDVQDGDEAAADKKSSGKGKIHSSRKGRLSSFANCPGVVPLVQIAKQVAEEYPDLANVQESCCPLIVDEDGVPPSWEPEDGSDGAGPLYEFCRQALCTTQFRRKCDQAVKAELDKIRSTRQGISIGGRKAGAVAAAAIDDAFEACFADACYLVQMLAKLPRSVATGDMAKEKKIALERDFLLGCAADFTCRITQYCLYKHGVDEGLFLVEFAPGSSSSPVQEITESCLPSFCHPVRMTTRSFGRVFLSCAPDKGGDKGDDPLPALRELLPGSIGIELARMWTSCGGECYQGGKKLGSEDCTEYVRPGNFEQFLRLAEESCLITCGLPFKKLDKKTEKSALFTRRRGLTAQLESSDANAREVLELTIMLLFQQIKGIVVAGNELIDTVLGILCEEKKIPEEVKNKLLLLYEHVKLADGDKDIPVDLIASIKGCGLSRDISKHHL